MSGNQDFICLFFGFLAAFLSYSVLFTFKYLRENIDSSKVKDIKLKLQKPPSFANKEENSKQEILKAGVSPFSVVQLHSESSNTSTSSALDSRPKEVEVKLAIAKTQDNDKNFDVSLEVVVDPESKEPLNVTVDALVDKDEESMNVIGKANSKAEGSVKIEGQFENDRKKMNLEVNSNRNGPLHVNSSDSDRMCLRSGKKK